MISNPYRLWEYFGPKLYRRRLEMKEHKTHKSSVEGHVGEYLIQLKSEFLTVRVQGEVPQVTIVALDPRCEINKATSFALR